MVFPAFITCVIALIAFIVWMTSKGMPWFIAIILAIGGVIVLIVAFIILALVMSTGKTGLGSKKYHGAD